MTEDDAGRLARGGDGTFDRRRVVFHLNLLLGAAKTTWPAAPLEAGSSAFSRSIACWYPVPGILNSSEKGFEIPSSTTAEDHEQAEPDRQDAASMAE